MPPAEAFNQSKNREKKAPGTLRRTYERFVKIRGNPREIALGFALGLFVGMSPAMGLHMAIAIFLAAIFKWNKVSSAIAVWISNPLTAPFLYSATYYIGAKILGRAGLSSAPAGIHELEFSTLLTKAPEILWSMLLGGVILGVPVAAVGYYFAYSALHRYQEDIRRKLAERREKQAVRKMQKALKRRKKQKNT